MAATPDVLTFFADLPSGQRVTVGVHVDTSSGLDARVRSATVEDDPDDDTRMILRASSVDLDDLAAVSALGLAAADCDHIRALCIRRLEAWRAETRARCAPWCEVDRQKLRAIALSTLSLDADGLAYVNARRMTTWERVVAPLEADGVVRRLWLAAKRDAAKRASAEGGAA